MAEVNLRSWSEISQAADGLQLNPSAAMLEHILARMARIGARLDEYDRRSSTVHPPFRPEPDPPDGPPLYAATAQPYQPYTPQPDAPQPCFPNQPPPSHNYYQPPPQPRQTYQPLPLPPNNYPQPPLTAAAAAASLSHQNYQQPPLHPPQTYQQQPLTGRATQRQPRQQFPQPNSCWYPPTQHLHTPLQYPSHTGGLTAYSGYELYTQRIPQPPDSAPPYGAPIYGLPGAQPQRREAIQPDVHGSKHRMREQEGEVSDPSCLDVPIEYPCDGARIVDCVCDRGKGELELGDSKAPILETAAKKSMDGDADYSDTRSVSNIDIGLPSENRGSRERRGGSPKGQQVSSFGEISTPGSPDVSEEEYVQETAVHRTMETNDSLNGMSSFLDEIGDSKSSLLDDNYENKATFDDDEFIEMDLQSVKLSDDSDLDLDLDFRVKRSHLERDSVNMSFERGSVVKKALVLEGGQQPDSSASFEEAKSVLIAKVDCDEHKGVCSKNGVSWYPAFQWFPKESLEPKKYEGERSVEALAEFVINEGGTDVNITAVPSSVVGPTSRNFDEILLREKKDVLVVFYEPRGGPGKTPAPTYEKVATTLNRDSDVVIANLNADKYKNLAEKYGVNGYPRLKFILKNNKDGEDYDAGRDLDDCHFH